MPADSAREEFRWMMVSRVIPKQIFLRKAFRMTKNKSAVFADGTNAFFLASAYYCERYGAEKYLHECRSGVASPILKSVGFSPRLIA